nr:hypothetical protein [Prolixibacteraceae bacterium]
LNNVEVVFEVEGNAQILNPENIKSEAGIATALLKIGNQNEPLIINAKAKNLPPQKMNIELQ